MSEPPSSEFEHVEFVMLGAHAQVASAEDLAYAIHQAKAVFHRNNIDPMACQDAIEKLEKDELLSREEALMCLIWDEAEDIAFKSATIGWLSRDVDLRLAVKLKPTFRQNNASLPLDREKPR